MVREGMLDEVEPARAQLAKEALRIADAGHGVHALPAKARQRPRRSAAHRAARASPAISSMLQRRRPGAASSCERGVHRPRRSAPRRSARSEARRAARAAVRPAAAGRCRSRARHRCTTISQSRARRRCCRPSSREDDLDAAADQQRARRARDPRPPPWRTRCGARSSSGSSPTSRQSDSASHHARGAAPRAAVAARQRCRPCSPRALQLAGEPDDERRLAGAADGEVADDDHRARRRARGAASRAA